METVDRMRSAIEDLSRSIQSVQGCATEADARARQTNALAERGGQAMQKSIEAMERIPHQFGANQRDHPDDFGDCQPDELAGVECRHRGGAGRRARHGLRGGRRRGAEACRCSNQATREISTLIKESSQHVEEGAKLSVETDASLRNIIQGAEVTAKEISEIAGAMVEQAASAAEASGAIGGIREVTERVAAGSEEMASSSEEVGAQAQMLRQVVSRFQTA